MCEWGFSVLWITHKHNTMATTILSPTMYFQVTADVMHMISRHSKLVVLGDREMSSDKPSRPITLLDANRAHGRDPNLFVIGRKCCDNRRHSAGYCGEVNWDEVIIATILLHWTIWNHSTNQFRISHKPAHNGNPKFWIVFVLSHVIPSNPGN